MKWKKVIKITHKYVPWQCFYSQINVTFSCPCAHHEDIWERGGTTQHIIKLVLLHTMPSDNILATVLSMLTFLLLHNISLATKWHRWLFHSLYRVSQEECARLRESVPYVKLYRYNPNTYIQSWTVTEIMAIEKCGLLGCPSTVRCPWSHTCPLRMSSNESSLANTAVSAR